MRTGIMAMRNRAGMRNRMVMRNRVGFVAVLVRVALLVSMALGGVWGTAGVAWAESFQARQGTALNAQAGPGTDYGIITRLAPGTRVEELQRDGNWSQVRLPNGTAVRLHNGYLTLISGSQAEPILKAGGQSSASNIRIFPQLGHAYGVTSVAFSPDGTRVLTGSADGTAILWDAATAKVLTRLITLNDGSWLVMTPEGFFNTSSSDAAQSINVVRGLEVLSIDNLYDALYRPDLVLEALRGDPDN